MIAIIPLYNLSVEHIKLENKYGKENGIRISEILGYISGWSFFLFWIGVWISPQPRFNIPLPSNISHFVELNQFSISLVNILISLPLIILGIWFGIKGTKCTTLKVAETHRTEKVVTIGVYSIIRHPQYLGGLLSHVGISFLISALYSILSTPLILLIVYLISRKEEKELIKEFGNEYLKYKEKVPMFIPTIER